MFTQEQLDLIKTAAKKTKNQGELAVYSKLITQSDYALWFSTQQLNIIKYCAEECKRQRSGEMSVYDMVNAWDWAHRKSVDYSNKELITLGFIEDLGVLVEPIDNKHGFRTIPIGVGDGTPFGWIEKAKFERVPELLETLIESYYEGNFNDETEIRFLAGAVESRNGYQERVIPITRPEDAFYFHYENIHPFVDGNGRTGKILYNYLCGTLDNPIMPPNFWGGSNP